MNSKKKNKNRQNKPPNPVPPQKSEAVSEGLDEKLKEPVEKEPPKPTAEVKVEERVPDILTKDPTVPVDAKKESETDAPKKPKRNRGKKKKDKDGDEFDDHENEKDIPKIVEEEPKRVAEGSKQETESTKPLVESDVENTAPNARKKKNKNKKHSEQVTPQNVSKDVDTNLEISETKKIESVVDDTTEEKPFETIESKKKNKKKKNRNDSEKSEKAEELPSCTLAFQKLLDANVETVKEELKSDVLVTDDSSISEATVKEVDISKSEPSNKPKSDTGVEVEDVISTETLKDGGGKNKKKGKKDKKNTQPNKEEVVSTQIMPSEVSDIKLEPSSPPVEISTDEFRINKDAPPPNLKIINMSVIENPFALEETKDENVTCSLQSKEKSPKPQHKNKKQADQKCKDKVIDKETKDSKINIEAVVEPLSEEQIPELLSLSDETDAQTKEKSLKPQAKIAKPVEKKQKSHKKSEEKKSDSAEAIQTTEHKNIHTPDESTKLMQVKDNKKSKVFTESLQEPVHVELKETKQMDTSCNLAKDLHEIIQNKPDDIERKENISCLMTDTGHLLEPTTDAQNLKEPALVAKETQKELKPKVDDEKEGIKEKQCIKPMDESKNKKRKKSPKPPVKQEQTLSELTDVVSESVKPHIDLPNEPTSEIKQAAEPCSNEAKAKKNPIPATEITPDVVEPPRSSSELADNNNNTMIIHEITSPEEEKTQSLPDSLSLPLIQGSGETPLASPEIVQQVSVQVTEMENVSNKQKKREATDLKSKVLEVNKDMEELRKSIERSLAELTSIETSEQTQKEKFAQKEQEKQMSTPTMPKSLSSEILPMVSEEVQPGKQEAIVEPSTMQGETLTTEIAATCDPSVPPICPARKDNKGKGKSKKKGKQDVQQTTLAASAADTTSTTESTSSTQETKKEEKPDNKNEQKDKGKQQASEGEEKCDSKPTEETTLSETSQSDFEPIESFEDALTSSVEDVNKTFEIIANEANDAIERSQPNPEINISAPSDETEDKKKREKVNPVSQPKNLLGHPDIPVRSNKMDYKKEKNKTPNAMQAKVKIKDATLIESKKQSTETQTDIRRKNLSAVTETVTSVMNDNEEYIYKYSFRKVYLPSACHVCTKDLKTSRVACGYCNLLFYCSTKHKDENWPQHQAFCFAVSTITHLKNQKYIYADAKNVTGHNYRLLRMQMIISCEKVLKRKLAPWEQEVLLYPRMCADPSCREWRQNKLTDCEICGQLSFCTEHPEHLPKLHQRWCKSYSLYQKLVTHQQTKGRLDPKMPSRIMKNSYQIPDKINMVLATLYEEKIDMNDMQYAALTQLATAPLTAAYCHQLFTNKMNACNANGFNKKSSLTLHVVGAELQFEADVLNKWEVFLAHLKPEVTNLEVVLIAPDLNPSNLPLELLGKISMCNECKQSNRKLSFSFQDKKTYYDYWSSNEFTTPDLVSAFNPSIHRSAAHNGNDPWPASINCILKQKVPFIITSYTITELNKDLARIKECSKVEYNLVSEPRFNNFASVRPDRNFISDEEMPLLFKNYCYMVLVGAL